MAGQSDIGHAGIDERVDGRRARSRRTRARIVEAAGQRFRKRGYVATTIESVAELAGVAVPTVYYVFGTKPALLRAVLDATIGGEDGTRPVVEQPWVGELADAASANEAVDRLATRSVGIIARVAPVYEVVRRAASDPEVADLLEANRRARRADQRALVEVLASAGHLSDDVDTETAADVVYALANEEVFGLLVGDCGWEVERYERWLADVLRSRIS